MAKFTMGDDYIQFGIYDLCCNMEQGNVFPNSDSGHICVTYGRPGTLVKIRTSPDRSGIVCSVECACMDGILHENFYLPDRRSRSDLHPLEYAVCNHDSGGGRLPCILNLRRDGKTLEIIFKANLNPKYYFADNRVEFYYDEHEDLLYLKVVDLTDGEYCRLQPPREVRK